MAVFMSESTTFPPSVQTVLAAVSFHADPDIVSFFTTGLISEVIIQLRHSLSCYCKCLHTV